MTKISIEKATILDAEKLTEIMKRTFDAEAKQWLYAKMMSLIITFNRQDIL